MTAACKIPCQLAELEPLYVLPLAKLFSVDMFALQVVIKIRVKMFSAERKGHFLRDGSETTYSCYVAELFHGPYFRCGRGT